MWYAVCECESNQEHIEMIFNLDDSSTAVLKSIVEAHQERSVEFTSRENSAMVPLDIQYAEVERTQQHVDKETVLGELEIPAMKVEMEQLKVALRESLER